MPLTVDAALDRPLVPAARVSERHLMLTLQPAAGGARRLPLNLALVIDRSGSMTGEKLARAKDAASLVVRHLTSVDRVAIVTYDDEVSLVAPSTSLTPQVKTDLLYRLSRIEAGGSTCLSGGRLTGCQEVARHQTGDGQLCRTLLLTDGLANVGITSIEALVEHARQLRSRGIVTSTMGIGVDFNEDLLEAVARHGGGRFQYVETAKHIPDCVQGELGELLQVAARKVAVEVTLSEGVRSLGCLNDYVLEDTNFGVRVHLGDLLAGETRRIVLKLAVSPGAIGVAYEIRSLALYVDAETGHGTERALPAVQLRYAHQTAADGQPTNEEVAREVALLLAARAKEDAVRLSRAGDDLAAASALANASQALSASALGADPTVGAEIASLAQLARQARQGLAERQRKELRYQAYLAREARRRYDPPTA